MELENSIQAKISKLRRSYQEGILQLSNLTNAEILELLHYEAIYQLYSREKDIRFIVDLLTERIFDKDFKIPESDENMLKEALTGIVMSYKRDSREGKAIKKLFKLPEHTEEEKEALENLIKILLLDLIPLDENEISENEKQS